MADDKDTSTDQASAERCPHFFVVGTDEYGCVLPAGHAGNHFFNIIGELDAGSALQD